MHPIFSSSVNCITSCFNNTSLGSTTLQSRTTVNAIASKVGAFDYESNEQALHVFSPPNQPQISITGRSGGNRDTLRPLHQLHLRIPGRSLRRNVDILSQFTGLWFCLFTTFDVIEKRHGDVCCLPTSAAIGLTFFANGFLHLDSCCFNDLCLACHPMLIRFFFFKKILNRMLAQVVFNNIQTYCPCHRLSTSVGVVETYLFFSLSLLLHKTWTCYVCYMISFLFLV